VNPILSRLLFAVGLSLLLSGVGYAQGGPKKDKGPKPESDKEAMKKLLAKAEEEYRVFKKPETTPAFWVHIKHEMDVGKFDVAAHHLDLMLGKLRKKAKELEDEKKDPLGAYEELLQIEEVEGLSSFLRLKTVRQWHDNPKLEDRAQKNVEELIDRLTEALDKRLSDPDRLSKFLKSYLEGPTAEERAYAFAQLDRARGRAAPFLLRKLQETVGKPQHQRVIDLMVKLKPDIMPRLFEALNPRDAKDAAANEDLRLSLLEVIRRRGEKRAVPYLWTLSASKTASEFLRNRATATLASLLDTDPRRLPPAKVVLTQMAERLHEHRVKFRDPKRIEVWQWQDDYTIKDKPARLTAPAYEEIFGLRYARQALQLDPGYRPAQLVFLNLMLQRVYKNGLDQVLLGKTDPSLDALLAGIDADLLLEALDRALAEHDLTTILPVGKALGDRGEVRAAREGTAGRPGVLLRALYYPDRRVQLAAALALLKMPTEPAPPAAARVVEVLRRFVAAGSTPKVLVAYSSVARGAELRKQVQAAGFEPVLAPTKKATFDALHRSADIDLILLHPAVGECQLSHALAPLRGDADGGLLPLLVITPPERRVAAERLAVSYRNVWVLPEAVLATDPDEFKLRLEESLKLATMPDRAVRAARQYELPSAEPPWPVRRFGKEGTVAYRSWLDEEAVKLKGRTLSKAERAVFAEEALDALGRMARGEVKGYDVRAAEPTILDALLREETAPRAVEILATFPGKQTQQRLADLVLDAKRGKLRVTAARALNRHIQKHGVVLSDPQIASLRRLSVEPGVEPTLRAQLAILMGSLRSTPEATGTRLYRFTPGAPPGK
jgi:hypothetical protein